MTDFRKALIDRMIHQYGFEDKKVILFARMCEKYPENAGWDKMLSMLVQAHEEYPVIEE